MTVDSAVLCARVGSNVPMSAEPARKKVRLYTCEPARSPGPVGVDEPQPAEASRAIEPSSTASVGSGSSTPTGPGDLAEIRRAHVSTPVTLEYPLPSSAR